MLVNVDAKALEWRVALCLSGDKVGINEILNDIDAHAANQKTFNLPSRLISKIYLFRTIFRGPAWSFANDVQFSEVSTSVKFWQGVEDKFYEKYNGLDKWHKRIWGEVERTGELTIPSGRTYTFEKVKRKGELVWDFPQICNYPVQGFSADLVKLARIRLLRRIKELGLKALIINTVHDSLVVDCPDDEVPIVVVEVYNALTMIEQNCLRLYKYKLAVPILGEVQIGRNYRDMYEVKLNGDVIDNDKKVIYNITLSGLV